MHGQGKEGVAGAAAMERNRSRTAAAAPIFSIHDDWERGIVAEASSARATTVRPWPTIVGTVGGNAGHCTGRR